MVVRQGVRVERYVRMREGSHCGRRARLCGGDVMLREARAEVGYSLGQAHPVLQDDQGPSSEPKKGPRLWWGTAVSDASLLGFSRATSRSHPSGVGSRKARTRSSPKPREEELKGAASSAEGEKAKRCWTPITQPDVSVVEINISFLLPSRNL